MIIKRENRRVQGKESSKKKGLKVKSLENRNKLKVLKETHFKYELSGYKQG